MRQAGPDGVLGLGDHGPLVHPAHPRRLIDDVIQRLRLLQLAQVVVLQRGGGHGGGGLNRFGSMYDWLTVVAFLSAAVAIIVVIIVNVVLIINSMAVIVFVGNQSNFIHNALFMQNSNLQNA